MEQTATRKQAREQGLKRIELAWPTYYTAIRHHRNAHGKPMDFKGPSRKWMRDYYKDNSPHTVTMKCSQIGATEKQLANLFTQAKAGLRGLYILPTDKKCNMFVADRVNGLQISSPEYAKNIKSIRKESDSLGQKSIYGNTCRFVGSNSRGNFHEFVADVIYFDEYDLCEKDNIPYAYDRIKHSKYKYVNILGNPEAESLGIHREYLDSDQQEWHVPCNKCGHEQVLDWFKHFVEKINGYYHLRNTEGNPTCLNCGQPFNRLGGGRFIPMAPENTIRGYHLSRLFADDTDDFVIINLYNLFIRSQNNQTALKKFWNTDLGLPYRNEEDKITEVDILRMATGEAWETIKPEGESEFIVRTVAGIDQGEYFHVHISRVVNGIRYKIFIGTKTEWSEVYDLLESYNVETAVIDAQGGGYAEVRKFVAEYDGAWMCYFRKLDQIKKIYDLMGDDGVVNTNRTESIDLAVKDIKEGRVVIPSDYKEIDNGDFLKQMTMPTRMEDSRGRPIWTKGVDHHFLAHDYETIALWISGMEDSQVKDNESWTIRRRVG